ncbi:MAG: thioredoxin domain-containing protein [Ferruginibacter sp.]
MNQPQKVIAFAFFVFHAMAGFAQTNTSLTAGEFETAISTDSIQLLDVRTFSEYASGHIKDALLADWKDASEFERRIEFIDKERPVYIYCLGGGRSAQAATHMRELGYTQVFELKDGINSWKAANKAVQGKSAEKQMSVAELNKGINTSKYVLVDFGAEWCPPCKKMEPVLKSLAKKHPGKFTLVKVDGGRDEDILRKYNITGLPVFILFKQGKQIWRKEGIADEKEIADLLD